MLSHRGKYVSCFCLFLCLFIRQDRIKCLLTRFTVSHQTARMLSGDVLELHWNVQRFTLQEREKASNPEIQFNMKPGIK